MKEKRLIYALRCPFTNEIHYIGKTTAGMTKPFSHLTKSHSPKIREWVDGLLELGYKPIISVLQTVTMKEDLDLMERSWIQRSLNNGDLLLNSNLVTPLLISADLDEILSDGNGKEMDRIVYFIKEKRKSVGLTQEEFALKTGIGLKTLRKIEQKNTHIQLDGLLKVLRMFGCSLGVVKIPRD
ncbi:MAG: hypothetical protein Unbinned4388contig1000_26 [Prokaryotic dsDNA virus sp.]|nr:MAG: hypothetical protein Unbinned4388contig1000_26 [Prokaryotic dsDNA virus sp.]